MDLLSGAVGTVIGGLGSTLIQHILAKPRLTLSISEVGIDPLQPENTEGIETEIFQKRANAFLITSEEYRELTGKNPYVPQIEKTYLHPSLFTLALYRVARNNAKAMILNRRMPEAIRSLKQHLNARMDAEFMSTWVEHQETIFSHLQGETRRGAFSIQEPTEENEKKYFMDRDVDDDYLVRVGSNNIGLVYSDVKTHKDSVERLCKYLAIALSTFDKTCLNAVITFLDSLEFDDPVYASTARATEEMLEKHSKVYTRCNITNSGLSGASILGNAKATINSTNYKMDKGRGTKISENMVIAMHAVEKNNITHKRAVIIPAGGCVSILFVSDEILLNLESDKILDLFGSERDCEITVSSEASKLLSCKARFSPAV
jgi:hypothetical protein